MADIIWKWHLGQVQENLHERPLFYLHISCSAQIEKKKSIWLQWQLIVFDGQRFQLYFPVSDDCLSAHQTKAHPRQPQRCDAGFSWLSSEDEQHPPPLLEQHRLASPDSAPLPSFSAVGSLELILLLWCHDVKKKSLLSDNGSFYLVELI